jgi:hypothetical protein
VKEKVAIPDQPALAICCQGKRRYQIADVGIVTQVASPGLQDPEHANLPIQETRIVGESLARRGGCVKKTA